MDKSIHDLDLHETVSVNNGMHAITRVPGGWLYECWRHKDGDDYEYEPYAVVFVPFNAEFTP